MSNFILAERRAEINNLLKAKGINKTVLTQIISVRTGKKYSVSYVCKILKGTREPKELIEVIRIILMELEIS